MYPRFLEKNLPYVLIAGVAFFMFRGIFAPGFMSGYDNSFHYYDAYYLTKTLIPQYHWISGWDMQGMAGMPIFVDYYQTAFLVIAIFNKLFFLPLNFSYKLMVLFSYIFLGAGFYKISSYRFGKIASLLIAICLMLQKDVYLDRILGGIWNNYLAIGLLFLFFHILDKDIEAVSIKKSLILGLLLGLLILTHLYVALFAFILLVIYIVPYLIDAINKKKPLLKQILFYICIPITAFMISSYYLYGFIIARDYLVKMPAKMFSRSLIWSLKSFFGPLENMGSALSTFMINVPVIIRIIFSFFGIYIFLRKEKDPNIRRFLTSVIVFIFIALILFSDILGNLFSGWLNIPFIATLQTNRFLIYIQLGMYLFAAYGIVRFLEYFKRKKFAITAFTISILLSLFTHYAYFAHNGSKTLEQSPQMSNVYKVWGWVNENIPPQEGRIVYQNTKFNMADPILGRSDVFALSGIFTKVPQIGVSRSASPFPQERYTRNDRGLIFGKDINTVDATFIRDMMEYFNSRYIVSVEPNLERILSKSELFFEERKFGRFVIFRLKNFKGTWISFKEAADFETLEFDNQCVKFGIWNKSVNNEAFVKVAYHPLWRVRLNNKPVEIKHDKYGLMKISLPDSGYCRLELSFKSFNPLWVTVSLLSLMGAGLVIGLSSMKRPVFTGPSRSKNA